MLTRPVGNFFFEEDELNWNSIDLGCTISVVYLSSNLDIYLKVCRKPTTSFTANTNNADRITDKNAN